MTSPDTRRAVALLWYATLPVPSNAGYLSWPTKSEKPEEPEADTDAEPVEDEDGDGS